MLTYVLYHKNCTDGFTAAWAARRSLRDENVRYIPIGYGDSLPEIEPGSAIFFLDFWPGAVRFQELAAQAKFVTVLDHHKTAEEDSKQLPKVPNTFLLFDQTKSGALLAWEWFDPHAESSWLVSYVSDHDLFNHALPWSADVSAFVQSQEHSWGRWDELHYGWTPKRAAECGSLIRQTFQKMVQQACGAAYNREISVNGVTMKIPVINVGYPLSQDVLTKLRDVHGLAISYSAMELDGKIAWKISARSSPQSPISARTFCESIGGGGHDHASGATVSTLPVSLI